MTEENQDFVVNWYGKFENMSLEECAKISNSNEKPLHPSRQFSSIAFLYNKLKDKDCNYFLHGEHDELYIGSFDMFYDFTEEELKEAVSYGIRLSEHGDGFKIYASM